MSDPNSDALPLGYIPCNFMAPQVGFEPTTWRLTAVRSTTELLEIFLPFFLFFVWSKKKKTVRKTKMENKFFLALQKHEKSFYLCFRVFIYMMYTNVLYQFFYQKNFKQILLFSSSFSFFLFTKRKKRKQKERKLRVPCCCHSKKRAYSLMVRTRCS